MNKKISVTFKTYALCLLMAISAMPKLYASHQWYRFGTRLMKQCRNTYMSSSIHTQNLGQDATLAIVATGSVWWVWWSLPMPRTIERYDRTSSYKEAEEKANRQTPEERKTMFSKIYESPRYLKAKRRIEEENKNK